MATQQRVGTVATTVQGGREGLRVVYHQTTVVHVQADKGIKLDSGGWRTATTKTRMNQASNQYGLGFRVYQTGGAWFVTWKGQDLPFTDGMVLRAEGE